MISMKNKNVVFIGTPDIAVPILEMLIDNTNVVMVVTKPDAYVGRKKELVYSPIKKVALKNNIPVFTPRNIRVEYKELEKLDIDLIVTCAYGQIIPKEVLDIPKYGCINIHASILPKYRGSSPIQWALFNGDDKTGITVMYMDEGMDTGNIIKIAEIPILDTDNVGTLHDKLGLLGRDTLKELLPDLLNGKVESIKQDDSKVTYTHLIKREDERLDFNGNGKDIINKIRGLNPWPLANIVIKDKEIKVIEATFVSKSVKEKGIIIEINKDSLGITCNDGIIYLKTIKPSGKSIVPIKAFINGINKEDYLNERVD